MRLLATLLLGASVGLAQPSTPVRVLIARLTLDSYKTTIKRLTEFGDRQQGTARNRAAVDWIEAQLKSYGCATERMSYEPPAQRARSTPDKGAQPRGYRARTGVNRDLEKQPDLTLRELNRPAPDDEPREQVFCTKIGSTHPEEMYLVSAHMDGLGYGQGADDDASGTALVMELARLFSAPDVRTDRTIRFALWNGEESGLVGARAYITQREKMQGRESAPGSRKYPEPKWLGLVQHDMVLFDHGMPRQDGTVSPEQRPEADINIEFQENAKFAKQALEFARHFQTANERYATDYPANIGPHMSNTDSGPFQDLIPAISVRESERLAQIGRGWNPHWHQPTDVFTTYHDDDFRLGLNAAQTTLGAIGELAGLSLVP